MNQYRVLIIEDERETANPVKGALELNEIQADIAENGEEGLKLFKEQKPRYDLVLLDLKMPGMQGDEVLKEIRKIDPYVFVVVYTNFGEFADIKKLVNIGIDKYVNKGPNAKLNDLIDIIIGLLDPFTAEGIKTLIDNTGEIPCVEEV